MNESPPNLWERFEGKPNTSEVLTEKGRFLARVLLTVISRMMTQFVEDVHKISPDELDVSKFEEACFETDYFCIHYCDRLCFRLLGEQSRNIFIDALVEGILERCLEELPDGIDPAHFCSFFYAQYAARTNEYANYTKEWAEKGEPLINTLWWEFEKRIVEGVFGSHSPATMMAFGQFVMLEFKFLNFVRLIVGK